MTASFSSPREARADDWCSACADPDSGYGVHKAQLSLTATPVHTNHHPLTVHSQLSELSLSSGPFTQQQTTIPAGQPGWVGGWVGSKQVFGFGKGECCKAAGGGWVGGGGVGREVGGARGESGVQ